ncbi:hypothetical protein F4558_005487 [Micromonospora profundi]|nr:hypothetical protein [Micromonospora profundi]
MWCTPSEAPEVVPSVTTFGLGALR